MHVFGVVAGTLAIVVLMRLAMRGFHHRHGWRHGGAWRHYGDGPGRHGGWHHRGGWRRYALYSLFERIDATPGQEKVIAGAMDELRTKLGQMRAQWSEQRHQAASTFRGESVTAEQADAVFAPFGQQFDQLRDAASEAMRKIHEALDDRQRRILADLVENGWLAGRC